MQLFEITTKIYFGENSLDALNNISDEQLVLVTDPFMVKSKMVNIVTDRLDKMKIPYTIFSDIQPDPTIETIAMGMEVILNKKPETLIALGGGSAIDACKAMLHFCVELKRKFTDEKYIHMPTFIAIPTTSGTGSEVTSYAVITDSLENIKIPISSQHMVPKIAILDPEFTKTLPKNMIAYTGMDVLSHGVEAYVSSVSNDFTNILAKESISFVSKYLVELYENVENDYLREKMYTASNMAGLSFTNSSLGLCHGIAHTIGAEFHLPHGKANAIILPRVVAFNSGLDLFGRDGVAKEYEEILGYVGFIHDNQKESCKQLISLLNIFLDKLNIEKSLKECNIDKAFFEERKEDCATKIMEDMCTKANPVKITRDEVLVLLDDIYEGRSGLI